MKKVALYSRSQRSRRVADVPEATDAAAPAPAPRAWRAFCTRHERPLLLAVGALVAVALVAINARMGPELREITQKDIDAAVLHTLENSPPPTMAVQAYEAIRPSVVRVIGLGPGVPDDAYKSFEFGKEKSPPEGTDKSGKDGSKDTAKDKDSAKSRDAAKSGEKGSPGTSPPNVASPATSPPERARTAIRMVMVASAWVPAW